MVSDKLFRNQSSRGAMFLAKTRKKKRTGLVLLTRQRNLALKLEVLSKPFFKQSGYEPLTAGNEL